MKYIHFLILTVGLLSHCFIIAQNSQYFYEQYAWDNNQNGRDVHFINDTTITICGNTITNETGKWDAFILKVGSHGNLMQLENHIEESTITSYRKIFSFDEQLTILGETLFLDDFPTSLNVANRLTKLDDTLGIQYSKWVSPNKDKVMSEGIKVGENYAISGHYVNNEDPIGFWQPYIAMIDSMGEVIWELELEGYEYNNRIGGLAWDEEENVLYAFGSINFISGQADLLFLKISIDGEIITLKETVSDMVESGGPMVKEGNYLYGISDYLTDSGYRFRVVKLSTLGTKVWEAQPFPNIRGSQGDIIVDNDGFIYTTGSILKNDNWEATLVKYDYSGNVLWKRIYGGLDDDYGYALANSPQGGLVITGRTESNTEGADVLLIKTNCMGLLTEPQAAFDYETNDIENGQEVFFENLSEFVYPDSIDGGHYLWDFGDGSTSNEISPSHTYPEEGGNYEVSLTAVVCQDTSIYQMCLFQDPELLCCLNINPLPTPAFNDDANINSLEVSFLNESENLYEDYTNSATSFWDFGDGNTSTDYHTYNAYEEPGVYKVSLSIILCNDTISLQRSLLVGDTTQTSLSEIALPSKVSVSPNPSSGSVTFSFAPQPKTQTLSLYNTMGQTIKESVIAPMSKTQEWQLGELPKGLYFWRLGEASGKLLLE